MATNTNKKSLLQRYFAFLGRRKVSDRLLFHIALITVCVSAIFLALNINVLFLTSVPTSGGTLVEGIVGTPRFVNPVLAITRADHDMVALLYSGLLRLDEHGNLVNDVARSVEVSEDGRTYHVILRENIYFHNGSPLTARDVAYTIALIQNTDLKSPLRGNWDGVLIEELGEYELNIVLEEAYTPFIENLTVGILPRDIWDSLPTEQLPFSQHNTEPIGSGPYQVDSVLRSKSGLINAYKLKAFTDSSQNPNITTLVFNFYQNEDELLTALASNEIAGTPSLSHETLAEVDTQMYNILQSPLPRVFTVYFNQNKSASLRDTAVRKALDGAIDREQLVEQVLNGFGIPTQTPVPAGFLPVESSDASSSTEQKLRPETILVNGGWTKTEAGFWEKEIDDEPVRLSVALTTSNTPLFENISNFVKESWEELGIEVSVEQYEQTDLVQGIIRPRDFQALLFGADIGRSIDLYPFWHSSQKDDPGLNIARYTNIDADAYLKDIRVGIDIELRNKAIHSFEALIKEDTPAVFLFVPTFGYVLDKNVSTTPIERLSKPSERFANISQWHIRSSALWPIFSETQ